jgi:hypothetical protein
VTSNQACPSFLPSGAIVLDWLTMPLKIKK